MSRADMAGSLRTWVTVLLTLAIVSQHCLGGRSHGGSKQQCKVCRSFVESFDKNFKATANSNFAGGDTSWEEEKLGSYSNSEVRLVEIMDEVCSTSDHDCHDLAATYEDDIERWWFKLRHKGESDLLKWLCFKHLDVCCSPGHFGPSCEPCPGGAEKPCGGHGTCRGEEEKNGLGTCSCNAGYHGDSCDACSDGYYSEGSLCIACNAACKTCGGGASSQCGECADGYMLDDTGVCVDKDECTLTPNLCKEGTYCANIPGSHSCNACDRSCQGGCSGPGASKCQSCAQGFTMSQDGFCEDKDECLLGEVVCAVGTYCRNTPGSHKCAGCHSSCLLACSGPGPEGCAECKAGYVKENGTCVDVNECDLEACDPDTEVCRNLEGGHVCNCREGYVRVKGRCALKKRKSKKKKEPVSNNVEQANAAVPGEQVTPGIPGEQANADIPGEEQQATGGHPAGEPPTPGDQLPSSPGASRDLPPPSPDMPLPTAPPQSCDPSAAECISSTPPPPVEVHLSPNQLPSSHGEL